MGFLRNGRETESSGSGQSGTLQKQCRGPHQPTGKHPVEPKQTLLAGTGLGETGFDSRQKLAAEVEKLTLADLEQTLSQLQRRKLTVSSNGKRFSQKDSKENIAQISSELKQLRSSGAIVPEA